MSNCNNSQQHVREQTVIYDALRILSNRLATPGHAMSSPCDTATFLKLKLSDLTSEVFCCLYLDSKHRLIKFDIVFTGTIDGCSVHPREIVKRVIEHNAAAVVFAHNHPSADPNASDADKSITQRLKSALALIDVRVLDHFIIGGTSHISFAERGLI